MLRHFKAVVCLAAACIALPAMGYSLLGPVNEAYQVGNIGYDLGGRDIGAPKKIGEEYRWNTPVAYYAFDPGFEDYFGSNGIYEVEQAIAILNALTNFTHYSDDLHEFPLESMRINYRAEALHLMDLKSHALRFIVEELGLTEPDRWTWALRDRYTQPGLACPFMVYHVQKLNYDPVTFEPTSYVNGNRYSYLIVEICSGPDPLADAYDFPVDPLAQEYSAVMSLGVSRYGVYATGLSRDDVGGLRYLLRTNNMNWEGVSGDSLLFQTNYPQTQLLVSSNLTLFAEQGLTNNAAALAALYPGLVILDTQNIFTNVVTTNVFAYYTNLPWSPATAPASLVVVTNYSTNVANWYQHAFGNVLTNTYYTNGVVTVLRTNVAPVTWGIPGTLFTNVTRRSQNVGLIMGDFFILPTNSACGISIIRTQLVSVVATTNTPIAATNAPQITNLFSQQFSESVVYYFTNYAFVIHPVSCETNPIARRQGMDRIKFLPISRTDYDPLTGLLFVPKTNHYRLYAQATTNAALVQQTFQRVVTRPDFLFTVRDLNASILERTDTAGNYVSVSNSLAGPGTIEPDMNITFNKVNPLLINIYSPFFILEGLSESAATTNFIWGSFSGGTNAPVVYPNGTSIKDLENQLLVAVTTISLPAGHVGVAYAAQLEAHAVAAQLPYVWSLSPSSPGLPPGLALSPDGLISGTPTAEGIYDFSVRVQEGGGRTADRALSIRIEW